VVVSKIDASVQRPNVLGEHGDADGYLIDPIRHFAAGLDIMRICDFAGPDALFADQSGDEAAFQRR